jgi:glycosyltransferase involved in cell wall biosynthesis
VNLERFAPEVAGFDRRACRAALGVAPGAVTVTYSGRFVRTKGIVEFCRVAERLRADVGDEVQFLAAGEIYDGAVDEDLRTYLRSVEASGAVRFLGWREDVREVLAATDVFALPSYFPEGLPFSLLEAAATGIPCVTTDTVGCRDAVDDGDSGFLVPPRDEKRLEQALRTLIGSPELRARMGRAARRKMEREHDVRHVVRQQVAMYEALLGVSARRGEPVVAAVP